MKSMKKINLLNKSSTEKRIGIFQNTKLLHQINLEEEKSIELEKGNYEIQISYDRIHNEKWKVVFEYILSVFSYLHGMEFIDFFTTTIIHLEIEDDVDLVYFEYGKINLDAKYKFKRLILKEVVLLFAIFLLIPIILLFVIGINFIKLNLAVSILFFFLNLIPILMIVYLVLKYDYKNQIK